MSSIIPPGGVQEVTPGTTGQGGAGITVTPDGQGGVIISLTPGVTTGQILYTSGAQHLLGFSIPVSTLDANADIQLSSTGAGIKTLVLQARADQTGGSATTRQLMVQRSDGTQSFSLDKEGIIYFAGTSGTHDITLARTGVNDLRMTGVGAASTRLLVNGAVATRRWLGFQTAAVDRFVFGLTDGAESGSNAGSDLEIKAYNDAGSLIDTPLVLVRAATGGFTFFRDVVVNTATVSSSTVTGCLVLAGGLGVAKAIYATGPLDIGGNKFHVDSTNGDLTKLRGVTYTWPSVQGGATTYLQNDGAGNLTWAAVGGGGGGLTGANAPLTVSGSNVLLGTAMGPTTVDANSSVTWSSSAANKKALVLQGNAAQSAHLFEAQDSTGAILLSITPAGVLRTDNVAAISTGTLTLNGNQGANSGTSVLVSDEAARTPTSGATYLLRTNVAFAPTSGTAAFVVLNVAGSVNQTGGANGITRSIFVNTQITAAADYRAIETSNDTGYAFYAGGNAPSFFTGNVGLGQGTFGTSATNTLAFATGTAPASSPADAFQMYSSDFAAGNAVPTFRTENGTIIKLNQTLTTTSTPTFAGMTLSFAGGSAGAVLVNNGSNALVWSPAATTATALADVLLGTSATTQKALVLQAQAGQTANVFEVQASNGSLGVGILGSTVFANNLKSNAAGNALNIQSNFAALSTGSAITFQGGARSAAASTLTNVIMQGTHNSAGGTATYSQMQFDCTINTTSSGANRDILMATTLTAGAIYHAIEQGFDGSAITGSVRGIKFANTFSPGSGTATYADVELATTFNQAGTGVTRGILINPTLTAANSYRPIEYLPSTSTTPLFKLDARGFIFFGSASVVGSTTPDRFIIGVGGTAKMTLGAASSATASWDSAVEHTSSYNYSGIYTAITPPDTLGGLHACIGVGGSDTDPSHFNSVIGLRTRQTGWGNAVAVASGDWIPGISFAGQSDTNKGGGMLLSANILGQVDGTVVSNTAVPIALVFNTSVTKASGLTERFRISSSGLATFTTGTRTDTSGNVVGVTHSATFAPTSGTATWAAIQSSTTINQTGGANGITRGIYMNPTLTAAADYRPFEYAPSSTTLFVVKSTGAVGINTQANALSAILDVRQVLITDVICNLQKMDNTSSANFLQCTNVGGMAIALIRGIDGRMSAPGLVAINTSLTLKGASSSTLSAPDVTIGSSVNRARTSTTQAAVQFATIYNPGTSTTCRYAHTVIECTTNLGSASNGANSTTDLSISPTLTSFTDHRYLWLTGTAGVSATATPATLYGFYSDIKFAPTSGSCVFAGLYLNNTINQTGGANGITRGIWLNATITAAADYRAFEVGTGALIIRSNGSIISTATLALNIGTITGTTTIADGDTNSTLLCNATGGSFDVNLPTAAAANKGRLITVKKIDATGNTVTIKRSGTDTIDGATSQVITTQWTSITVQSDGSNWYIV